MMNYQRPILGIAIIVLMSVCSISATTDLDNRLSDLYESLLQREYAGPISFPDHQVERKAQRSPSLRLRFGRSDPDMVDQYIEKRWLGDVNQKPIRSPSLRLRFGRRSDPMMAAANAFDLLSNYEDNDNYRREQRKPSGRLRWGRSASSADQNENLYDEADSQRTRRSLENVNIADSETLLALLNALRELDDNQVLNSNEFEREIRKPGPMRLRWGRSTGHVQPLDHHKAVSPVNDELSSNDISTSPTTKV